MKYVISGFLVLLWMAPAGAQQVVQVTGDTPAAETAGEEAVAPEDQSILIEGFAPDAGYGYTREAPILIGGLNDGAFDRRLSEYFRLLRAANGDPMIFVLSRTCCAFETETNAAGGFLQGYGAGIKNGKPVFIYINGYDRGPVYAPQGTLAPRSSANLAVIDEAVADARARRLDGAKTQLVPLAEAGDVMAQYHLGRVLADEEAFEAAYGWFMKAAEAGHNISQATVAAMLEEGKGVPVNPALAQQWLRRAASNGHAGSRMQVALKLISGPPDETRLKEGARLLHMAAEQGDPAAQAAYGLMLVYGRGMRADRFQGMVWLYLAQEAGDRNAESLYPRLASEESAQMVRRVTLAAQEWLDRPGSPPVVPASEIPIYYAE